MSTRKTMNGSWACSLLALLGLLAFGHPPVQAADRAEDKYRICEAESGIVVCNGKAASGGTASRALEPTIGRRPSSENRVQNHPCHQYLGNNTCRYRCALYSAGDSSPDDAFSISVYAVSEGPHGEQDAHAAANTFATALVPQIRSHWAYAEAGIAIRMPSNTPAGSKMTVTYPWHTRGLLDVTAGTAGGASAIAHHRLWIELKRNDTPTTKKVADKAQATSFGPKTENVSLNGSGAITIAQAANDVLTGLIRNRVDVLVSSDFGSDAAAEADFARQDLGRFAWLDYQDWKYVLPPGWVVTTCG